MNHKDQWLELPHDFASRVLEDDNALRVPLLDPQGVEQVHTLVPMKDTVLRRVTFKVRAAPPGGSSPSSVR